MLGIDVKVDRSGGIIMNSYAKCAVSNSACRESGRLWKTRHVNLWSCLARADSWRRECVGIVFLMIFMSPAGHMPLRKMIPSWRPLPLFESPESDLDVKSELNRTQSTHRSEGPTACSNSVPHAWTNSACSWSQHDYIPWREVRSHVDIPADTNPLASNGPAWRIASGQLLIEWCSCWQEVISVLSLALSNVVRRSWDRLRLI